VLIQGAQLISFQRFGTQFALNVVRMNAILVEEEKDSLLSVELILKFNGYKVETFKNLNEAIDKILAVEKNASIWDLLITDIPVSRLDDKNLMGKREELSRAFPFYVITDCVDREIFKKYKKKGFYLIERPLQPQDLLKRIGETLQE
jgi:DNA-binding NtrC family response regulator